MRKRLLSAISLMFVLLLVPVLSACEAKSEVTISVMSSYINDGNVNGGGIYETDDTVVLIASPTQNASFVAWIKNNIVVSTDAEFEFKAKSSSSGVYTAVFAGENPAYYNAREITFFAKHSLNESSDVLLTSISLKISQLNSSISYTLFEQENLNLTLSNDSSQSEPFLLEAEYFLSRNNAFKIVANVGYELNGQAQKMPQKSLDFSVVNLAEIEVENAPSFKRLTLKSTTSALEVEIIFDIYPAGFSFE